MTMLRFCRLVRTQRFMSTTTDAASRPGYGPGFSPPKGSRETPKLVSKRRDVATSLPSHLGNAETQKKTTNSTKQKFREDMRLRRHAYARDLLEKHGKRQAASTMKQTENEHEAQTGRILLSHIKQKLEAHEKEVSDMLELDSLAATDTRAEHADRAARRIANRAAHVERIQNERRKLLVKLYRVAGDFVTLENLDENVDQMLDVVRKPYTATLESLIVSPLAEHKELEKRKELLKETMGL